MLVDGRRVAKSPIVGDAVDMNSIPIAAVERIEILTDGASAIYGSDAIGGVINVILRKDFEGVALAYGETKPDVKGGDRKEMSAIMGVRGDKGRVIVGAYRRPRATSSSCATTRGAPTVGARRSRSLLRG